MPNFDHLDDSAMAQSNALSREVSYQGKTLNAEFENVPDAFNASGPSFSMFGVFSAPTRQRVNEPLHRVSCTLQDKFYIIAFMPIVKRRRAVLVSEN